MKTVKKGDKYKGTPGEIVTLQLSKHKSLRVVLIATDYLDPCSGCPLSEVPGECTNYLEGICCIPVEDAVE